MPELLAALDAFLQEHRRCNTNPFTLTANVSTGERGAFFFLDPRDRALGPSDRPVNVDLLDMLAFVDERCRTILDALG
jgi:hypothetical protein